MEREKKLELMQRTLGIKHKLKVFDSMKPPETHEDLAVMMLGRWELEDELHAIEELLNEARAKNIKAKRVLVEKESVLKKKKEK